MKISHSKIDIATLRTSSAIWLKFTDKNTPPTSFTLYRYVTLIICISHSDVHACKFSKQGHLSDLCFAILILQSCMSINFVFRFQFFKFFIILFRFILHTENGHRNVTLRLFNVHCFLVFLSASEIWHDKQHPQVSLLFFAVLPIIVIGMKSLIGGRSSLPILTRYSKHAGFPPLETNLLHPRRTSKPMDLILNQNINTEAEVYRNGKWRLPPELTTTSALILYI